jgi:hypothetical protein
MGIDITMKLPQMFQIGNHGLVLKHTFKTGQTVAFLHGWSVLTAMNKVTGEDMPPYTYRLAASIQHMVSCWTHPLLLPLVLLEDHIHRAREFKEYKLTRRTTDLEGHLGVTRTGHLADRKEAVGAQIRELMSNDDARLYLTTGLSSTITDTATLLGVLRWDFRCCQFIRKSCGRVRQMGPHNSKRASRLLEEAIDTLECGIESVQEHTESIKERLELQLTVVRATHVRYPYDYTANIMCLRIAI